MITRRIEIDAGHRIQHHGGMCAGLHGHRYVIEAEAFSDIVTAGREKDMVMDFGRLKSTMMHLIHERFDHALILEWTDPIAQIIAGATIEQIPNRVWTIQPEPTFNTKLCLMKYAPTAERLAQLFHDMLDEELGNVVRVTVWETPNCYAISRA